MALLRRHWLEAAWALFVAVNLVAIVHPFGQGETIPFHFVWLSLTFVYLMRPWSLRVAALVTLGVMIASGIALGLEVASGPQGVDELAEVPLMAAMFSMMVVYEQRRQATNRKLGGATQRERDFVREASHQLRTPITVAQGHAELIRASEVGRESAVDAEIILDELQRLATISEQLLLIASAEDPRFLLRDRLDFGDLLRTEHKRWAATADRRWHVEVGTEGTLLGDRERLRSALDALIENALNATEEGDEISIVGRTEDGAAVIEISDSGRGVAPEDLDRIFDRFSRGTRRREQGTGLGLAIVKAIVEAHGGSVTATSGLGRGSTFRLRLGKLRAQEPSIVRALERVGSAVGRPNGVASRAR